MERLATVVVGPVVPSNHERWVPLLLSTVLPDTLDIRTGTLPPRVSAGPSCPQGRCRVEDCSALYPAPSHGRHGCRNFPAPWGTGAPVFLCPDPQGPLPASSQGFGHTPPISGPGPRSKPLQTLLSLLTAGLFVGSWDCIFL